MAVCVLICFSPLVDISMGRTVTKNRDPNSYVGDYAADLAVKTYAPMDVRHLVGSYHVNIADKGVKADLKLNSVTDNQNVALDVSWTKKDENSYEKSLGIKVNKYQIKTRVMANFITFERQIIEQIKIDLFRMPQAYKKDLRAIIPVEKWKEKPNGLKIIKTRNLRGT